MNVNTRKALFLDAFYQVLDNSVFRILAVLVLLPVAAVFLIGFHEDHLSLLFGLREWKYDLLLSVFDGGTPADGLGRDAFVSALVSLIVEIYAGGFGLLFCIAATSFFVPRMIEKGAADVLFHKPISRLSLYLSSYLAGLLFVGLLSAVLAVGVYAGLLIVSGYNDAGVLWAAPGLVYIFGLVYPVAMAIGAFTRSTVASILLCGIFFLVNGCVHKSWIGVEQGRLAEIAAAGEDEPLPEHPGGVVGGLLTALETAHFVLPKTTDATLILEKARRYVSRPGFEDGESGLRLAHLAAGMEPADLPAGMSPFDRAAAEALGRRLFFARDEAGTTRLAVWRRPKREVTTRTRTRPERLLEAGELLEQALADLPGLVSLDEGGLPRNSAEDGLRIERSNRTVSGRRAAEGDELAFWHVILQADGSFVTLSFETPAQGATERFAAQLAEVGRVDPSSGYKSRLGIRAPWKYNILFSIGSSVAFAVLLLALGWWKVSRIDF